MENALDHTSAVDVAANFERDWQEATIQADADRLIALFADDVVFLGSHPRMYVGETELRDYLASVPMGGPMTIAFGDRQVRVIGPEAFTSTSYVTFSTVGDNGVAHRFRWAISWTIVKQDGGWRIVQHHASSRPEA